MAIVDLFSKRQKRLRGKTPDVFRYDYFPVPLRVQIVHIWDDAIGPDQVAYNNPPEALFARVERTLLKEYGLQALAGRREEPRIAVSNFFLGCPDVKQCLDVVEIMFSAIEQVVRRAPQAFYNAPASPKEAILELNHRFREHAVGYEYQGGQIIQVDSQFLHAEVVLPALRFLQAEFLAGANQEFLSAHEHYRSKRYKECLVESAKAFESTMKAICNKRGWECPRGATAQGLIGTCIKEGLFPAFLEQHLTGLRLTLESGVPTVRNKLAAHGQGTTPVAVPEEVASYALHLTAMNILFLAGSDDMLK